MKPLQRIADTAVRKVARSFPTLDITPDQRASVADAIEEALLDTVEEATRAHHDATVQCCGPEADLAHKIANEVSQRTSLMMESLNHQR